jgi:hypothetical protein
MSFVFRYLLAVLATVLILNLGNPSARAADAGATLIYPASYFAGMELNTVQDMVTRLPGFVFVDTDTTKRGFASSAGNVLIDGVRPSSKTDILSAVLDRIAISRVDRIEVIRGGAPGIDMQGQTVVANVVLKKADETHVIATLWDTAYGDGHQGPGGSVELNGRAGDNTYDVTLTRINKTYDDSAGNGIRYTTVPGQPTVIDGAHRRGAEQVGYAVNASLSRPLWSGAFSTNLMLQETIYNSAVFYDDPGAVDYPSSLKVRTAEWGANWDRNFGPVELTVIGLQRLERDQNFNAALSSGNDQIFHSVGDTGESILRATARYIPSQPLMLETGLEGAYNFLNGQSSFLVNGAPMTLPGANPRVNEKRGEAFGQATWRFLPDWAVEAGARFEFSTIAAQGIPARSFDFLKPRLLLSWSPADNMQIRMRAERVVGQLDFNDFIASSNFSQNGVSAGNLLLKPDQHWQFEGDYEYHFWEKGALVLSYTRENITDLIDYVPIGGGLDGPGNIPKATNNIYDVELSLPLDRVNLEGTTIKPSLLWKDGAVADPVTGAIRQISGTQDRLLSINVLQDIASWNSSITLTFQTAFQRPYFRIAQVTDFRLHPLYVELDWDYKPRPDLDLLVKLPNIIPYQFDEIQYNYAGPRDVFPLASIQDTHTHSEPRIYLQLRKTF